MSRLRALSICLVGALAAACRSTPPAEAPAPVTARTPGVVVLNETQIKNAGLVVGAAEQRARSAETVVPARVALDETRTARIGSLQEGLILQTLAQVGDRVRTGQLLATMHGHAMHDAWAGYRIARAELRRLESELAFAVDAHERLVRLYAEKAVALQEVRRAEVERHGASERVTAAKAEVIRSIEELEHVGVEIDSAEPDTLETNATEQIPVRSPMPGAVLERLVTPGTTVTPGTPLYVVSDLSTLWVIAQVDDAMAGTVSRGQPVTVSVAAYPDDRFTATVSFVADAIDPETRRLVVRATLANPGLRLKPDMLATMTLGGAPRTVVVVPRRAIQTLDGQTTVFVAEPGNRFVARAVTLSEAGADPVEIVSGLAAGERYVVDGAFILKSQVLAAEGGQ
jgi:cobalt-zinc-cadmium efflux system membrane fusion protein